MSASTVSPRDRRACRTRGSVSWSAGIWSVSSGRTMPISMSITRDSVSGDVRPGTSRADILIDARLPIAHLPKTIRRMRTSVRRRELDRASSDLPGLPAIVPGRQRGRDRGPGGHRAAPGPHRRTLAPPRCGSRPSTPRRAWTWATTSPTSATWTRCSATWPRWTDWWSRPTSAICGVLLDLVPCHTSIEHPWFTEHPEYYVWADGDAPPNNWVANFGGPAWTRDPARGRWYLHSYYPEMPDLDWRNPDVVAAMQDVVRFWLDRGVDGFRLDAIQGLMKDPAMRDDPPAAPAVRAPPARGVRAAGPRALHQQPRRGRRGGGAAGGRRRRPAGGRGVPARGRPRAVPGAPGRGVRVRAAARAVGRGRAAGGDRRPTRAAARPGCCPTTTSRACPRV